jgi:hypothetical protein
MTTQHHHLARKATALLSAIAASSLLGLPALAGGLSGNATSAGEQAQTPSGSDQTQCTPVNQSSNAPTATPDASANGAAQLPNQADPRAGATPSEQASRTDGSTANTSSMQMNDAANARSQNSAYRDVLSQGGATSGGFASQQVAMANNPDGYRTASSRYSSNDPRANDGNYRNSDNTASSNAMSNNAMGNTSAGMNSSDSLRSDSMRQPSSQSSRMTTGTMIAQCPSGTVPRSATPENRQATPENRQAPDQPNPGMQTSPQPTDPQMRQAPQAPADDNGSRTR